MTEEVETERLSFTQFFESAFPFFLMIGMSPEQYWEGDPYLAKSYYEAHKLSIEQRNQILWLQGWYVYKGVEVVVANALRKRGRPTVNYIEKPLDLFHTEQQIEEEKALKERQKAIEGFETMRKLWGLKHG